MKLSVTDTSVWLFELCSYLNHTWPSNQSYPQARDDVSIPVRAGEAADFGYRCRCSSPLSRSRYWRTVWDAALQCGHFGLSLGLPAHLFNIRKAAEDGQYF